MLGIELLVWLLVSVFNKRTPENTLMILLDLFWGILTALSILFFISHLGILINMMIINRNPDMLAENDFLSEPDGVEEDIIMADGVRIRSLHKASGPPVLLIPDIGLSMVSMNLLWRQLADRGFQVITFDHRGHGSSEKVAAELNPEILVNDLRAVINYYELKECILVGHSAGAFLAMKYLLDYSEEGKKHIKGLVSLAGFGGLDFNRIHSRRFPFSLINAGILRILLKTKLYGWGFSAAAFGSQPAPSMLKAFMKVMQADHYPLIQSVWKQIGSQNLYSRLSELELPVTLISSRNDQRIDPSSSIALQKHLPLASSAWFDSRIGNMMIWEVPGKIAEIIRLFERDGKLSEDLT